MLYGPLFLLCSIALCFAQLAEQSTTSDNASCKCSGDESSMTCSCNKDCKCSGNQDTVSSESASASGDQSTTTSGNSSCQCRGDQSSNQCFCRDECKCLGNQSIASSDNVSTSGDQSTTTSDNSSHQCRGDQSSNPCSCTNGCKCLGILSSASSDNASTSGDQSTTTSDNTSCQCRGDHSSNPCSCTNDCKCSGYKGTTCSNTDCSSDPNSSSCSCTEGSSCSVSNKYGCLTTEKPCCSRSTYGRYCNSCKGCDPREDPRPEDQCQFTTGCDDCKCGNPSKRPNIVIFVADDAGWNDIGAHGSCKANTPDIDAFFYNSVIMHYTYVSRVCSPTRGAALSGKYPHVEGMDQAAILGGQPYCWPLRTKFLSNYMKDMCYKTYLVGKWNLGLYKKSCWPRSRGFDCSLGGLGSHQNFWNSRTLDPAIFGNISLQQILQNPTALTNGTNQIGFDCRDNERMAYEVAGQRATDVYDRRVVEHIEKHNYSCPMFLLYTHPAPHADNNNQIPALDKYIPQNVSNIRRAKTLGLNSEASNSLGIMIDALKKKDILDNTYIIYISDNGGDGSPASAGSNCPLKGCKFTPLEGGIRSTCAIWGPNVKSGRVVREPVHVTDLLPTIVRMAGGLCGKDKDGLKNIDGKDQYDTIMNGQRSARTEVVHAIDLYGDYYAISMKLFGIWFKYLKSTAFSGALDKYLYPCDREGCVYNKTAVINSKTFKALKSNMSLAQIDDLRAQITIDCPQTSDCNLTQTPHTCLHKIMDDPCENKNVAAQYPLVVAIMEEKIAQEIKRAAVPRFPPFEPRADPKYWCNEWTNYGDCLGLQ